MTKAQITALRKKLKAAVAVQKKKGMTLKASHQVYSPGNKCCCLLGAVIGRVEHQFRYSVQAAATLKITEEEAMQIEAGFMAWLTFSDPVLYALGAEFRP